MKTLEDIKAMRDELAEEHEDWTLGSRSKRDFQAGFDAAIGLMEERERVVAKKLEASCYCDDGGYRSLEPCEACEGLKLLNLTKGEK